MNPRRRSAIAGSPVLIGAVTTLVTVVAVFLAYNANNGLPFVPTYDLKADLPNGANLVKGNEVRIGGSRVGIVTSIDPVRRPDGTTYARVNMKLERRIEPLPLDSTVLVRPRSAIGLKYIEITPGQSRAGYPNGATIPLSQATPRPVEIDDVLNTFDARTRQGSKQSIRGFGDALIGRGADINTAIQEFKPLLAHLEPVAANLASQSTALDRFFPSLERAASQVAPVARQQGELFANLDTTFTALAGIARPYLQETISKSPPAEDAAIREFPKQRPFLVNSAGFFRDLRPGAAVLPRAATNLAATVRAGVPVLKDSPRFNRELADSFRSLQDFATDPLVPRGLQRLDDLMTTLDPTLRFLTPVQTTCNYVSVLLRNGQDLLGEGNGRGTWQSFVIVSSPVGPNAEGSPASAPANGPTIDNHLHSDIYPNTASPGQPKECEAGNEPYIAGRTVIGNLPGNQGVVTDMQPRKGGSR
ncbi:MAG: MCE family protein [Thermoleophilaceae bacterium]|nr:MCE family protein [Thermoleophilaceae bacterium]